MCEVTKFNTGTKHIALFFSRSATKVFEILPYINFNKIPSCQGGLRGRNSLFWFFFSPLPPTEALGDILSCLKPLEYLSE